MALVTHPAHGAPVSIRVCTVNVQNTPDMPDRKVRADVRTAKEHCQLILWQEIGEKADHRAITSVLGKGWATTPRAKGGAPISWRTNRLHQVGKPSTTKIVAGLGRCSSGKPSYSPAKYLTGVRLRMSGLAPELRVYSPHFPPGAWGAASKNCRQPERKRQWRTAYAAVDKRVEQARTAGAWVIAGGDWNRRRDQITRMRATQTWVTPKKKGLDHIFIDGPSSVRGVCRLVVPVRVERVQETEKVVDHPTVGQIALTQTVLQVVDASRALYLILYTPSPGTDTAEKLRKLAINPTGNR
jgi:MmyB-like transcription regulator ligand binding domain